MNDKETFHMRLQIYKKVTSPTIGLVTDMRLLMCPID